MNMLAQFDRLCKRLGRDDKASVGLIFGLALVPMVGLTGAAIDYARASAVRNELQVAADATALALAKDAVMETAAQYTARAQAVFNANWAARHGAALQSFTVTKGQERFTVAAVARVDHIMMRLLGANSGNVSASATSGYGLNKIEIALVLDNTGSMGSSNKMQELKKALCGNTTCSNPNPSTGFVAQMRSAAMFNDQIRIALVPFDTMVRVPQGVQNSVNAGTPVSATFSYGGAGYCAANPTSAQRLSWFRFAARDKNSPDWSASAACDLALKPTPATWQGCVWDRDQDSARDSRPTGLDPLGIETLYPATSCRSNTFARMAPLVDVKNSGNAAGLIAAIGAMQPSGFTNLTVGVSWGINMLTPGLPMSTAAAPEPNLQRFLILLTDGDNTENRQGRNTSGNAPEIDARTQLACNEAKKPANGITVYAIRVINGNQALLRNCASSPSTYYEVNTAAELDSVFRSIAGKISGIRLTS